MTDTYGSLKEAIAEDIHEPADASVVKRVVQSALLFYRGYRFTFSEASDIITVPVGAHTLRGALPPRIQKPHTIAGQAEGQVESLFTKNDGLFVVTPENDPSLDKNLDFEFGTIDQAGVQSVTLRLRWNPSAFPSAELIIEYINKETGVSASPMGITALPDTPVDADGYVNYEWEMPLQQLQVADPDALYIWDLRLRMTGPSGLEIAWFDFLERKVTWQQQLPAGLGGIDNIQVNNGGVWFTTQRQSLSTLRGYETTRTIRGIPNIWCWHHQTLMLYPSPNRYTQLKIDYLMDPTRDEDTGLKFDADSPDTFTNAFFYDGGELLRTRACAIYALTRVHDQEMANRFKLLNQEIEQSLTRERTRPLFARTKVRGYWSGNSGGRRL